MGPRRTDAGDRVRRAVRALSSLPPPHARHRRDHLPGAALGRHRLMQPFRWKRIGPVHALAGVALGAGWVGIYFAFQGHWLGAALPLASTALTFAALRAGDERARRRSTALQDALAASAARNRELERLRRVAATLLASNEIADLFEDISDAAAELLEAESGGVALV